MPHIVVVYMDLTRLQSQNGGGYGGFGTSTPPTLQDSMMVERFA